jgi:hypothetical protein
LQELIEGLRLTSNPKVVLVVSDKVGKRFKKEQIVKMPCENSLFVAMIGSPFLLGHLVRAEIQEKLAGFLDRGYRERDRSRHGAAPM